MESDALLRLREDPILKTIFDVIIATRARAYLVGGVLRNLVLSRPLGFDYDIALDGKVKDVANLLAQKLKGSPFLLDKKLGSYRISIKNISDLKPSFSHLDSQIHIDLSLCKGQDIFEDLKGRDFTINAMALDIHELYTKKEVDMIDIFHGKTDAENKTIKMIHQGIFEEDPVRLLRAIRLSAQYGLTMERETEIRIKTKANLLTTSSFERIRDEFFIILGSPKAAYYVEMLNKLSLLYEIIPETREWEHMNDYDLVYHSIRTLEQGGNLLNNLDAFVPEFAERIDYYLKTSLGNIPRKGLLKLALFLHDAGKPLTMKVEGDRIRFIGHEVEGELAAKRIARRLKLSRTAVAFVAKLVRNHHRVFPMASLERPTDRSKAHLFRVMGGADGLPLLLLSLSDARATRDGDDPELASLVKDLIAFYYHVYAITKPKPLLKGKEVMEIFGIPEGIMVGRILKRLAEAEEEGMVKNKRDAIRFIKSWLNESAS